MGKRIGESAQMPPADLFVWKAKGHQAQCLDAEAQPLRIKSLSENLL
jgi:hypothetical protein